MISSGCPLCAINSQQGSELRIVAAVGSKALLVSEEENRDDASVSASLLSPPDSPAEELRSVRVCAVQVLGI